MPFISDGHIAAIQQRFGKMNEALHSKKAKDIATKKADEIKETVEIVGAAAAMGFIRGKMEAADGSFNIPGTAVDVEMVVGVGLVAAGMLEALGKNYNEDLLAVGNGVLAHYVGQIARKWSKTGAFTMVAGHQAGGLL
jgi:hypothetical protein